ncbi:aegerolysin family [Fusarium sporotrichioides]|uniref:Aegerolysin family n=1 Tax=Fusarium sporotrichioides TaxID=5514 RepID=A0A395RVU7_FUSSP|nr:aegerolysin family [Fusarium sporotrichioides]
MAYAQWVYILIQNKIASGEISIRNVNLNWGKFYQWDNKDNEISVDAVKQIVIASGKTAGVASCGRSDASSGTEGSFDLYDGDTKICNIYWDCPWGSKTNTFTVGSVDDDYIVQATGANLNSGAIGTVNVKVAKF